MRDLDNIILNARSLLDDTCRNPFWTDTMLISYLNDGIAIVSEMSVTTRVIADAKTTVMSPLVSFPGYRCIAVEYLKTALIKITPLQVGHVSVDGLHPQYWFEYNGSIGIEPIPPIEYPLRLYLISIPATIASDVDVPAVPTSYHALLKYYVVSRALEQDRKQQEASFYMGMFYNEMSFITSLAYPDSQDAYEDLRVK